MVGDRELISAAHIDGPEGARSRAPREPSRPRSASPPQKLQRWAAAVSSREAKWPQSAANWMRGQNANRCASFVSVGTRLHCLFRPK
jgi:hypothetical protein